MYKELSCPPFESLFQLTNQDKTIYKTLHKQRCAAVVFFSEKVINSWNQLDQSVVDAAVQLCGHVPTKTQYIQK